MSGLVKATLTKLSNDRKDTEIGKPVEVQFNPSSLKLTISNNTEGGQNTGRSQRQYTGNASTELAFDLVFDTADEVKSGGPRSVREKTAMVEQYVLAQGTGSERKSPPRVKFVWGGLIVKGVISQVSLDFDHFAEDGTPLRAKMGISIKEQDARVELLQSGPGSSTEKGAPRPGEGSGSGPGSKGGGANDPRANRTAAALAGESAADFAARVGLDPAAWRGLAAGLEGTLSLEAGVEIDFDASLEASAGIGLSAGVEADLGISLEASLGLETGVPLSTGAAAGASPSVAPGFALSAAGGVTAAVESVKIARADAAAAATVQAFAAPVRPTAAKVVSATPTSAVSGAAAAVALGATGGPGAGAGAGASAATGAARAFAPPLADPRATSFGLGVPLRPRVTGAAEVGRGVVALRPYGPAREVPVTRDPTVPPWRQLPAPPPGWAAAEGAVPPGRTRVTCAGTVTGPSQVFPAGGAAAGAPGAKTSTSTPSPGGRGGAPGGFPPASGALPGGASRSSGGCGCGSSGGRR